MLSDFSADCLFTQLQNKQPINYHETNPYFVGNWSVDNKQKWAAVKSIYLQLSALFILSL